MCVADSLTSTILALLGGVCGEAFGLELGFSHYNDLVYGFEGQSTGQWVAWDSDEPIQTDEEAFCGRQSLHVRS